MYMYNNLRDAVTVDDNGPTNTEIAVVAATTSDSDIKVALTASSRVKTGGVTRLTPWKSSLRNLGSANACNLNDINAGGRRHRIVTTSMRRAFQRNRSHQSRRDSLESLDEFTIAPETAGVLARLTPTCGVKPLPLMKDSLGRLVWQHNWAWEISIQWLNTLYNDDVWNSESNKCIDMAISFQLKRLKWHKMDLLYLFLDNKAALVAGCRIALMPTEGTTEPISYSHCRLCARRWRRRCMLCAVCAYVQPFTP